MKLLIIINIDNYNYTLKDEYNNIYNLNIEIYDNELRINDLIYISDNLIKENALLSFGPIKKEISNKEDLLVVLRNNEKYYLERYYG